MGRFTKIAEAGTRRLERNQLAGPSAGFGHGPSGNIMPWAVAGTVAILESPPIPTLYKENCQVGHEHHRLFAGVDAKNRSFCQRRSSTVAWFRGEE